MALREAIIVAACRTPIAQFGGSFSSLKAPQLGSEVIKAAIARAGILPEHVDELFFGNVCSAGIGQAPARQAALGAGLPNTVPCTTVNKVCASGLKSVMFAAQSVMLGHQDVVMAGGFESMSNIPHYMKNGRSGVKLGNVELVDGLVSDGLWDPYNNQHMGMCAEHCADTFGFSREDQDAYAMESYRRSAAAHAAGKFESEIVPVAVPQGRGRDDVLVSADEEFGSIKLDKLPTLRPAFKRDGSVTAANSSTINDGASAVLVMSAERAKELGVTPLARIRGFGDAAHEPINFTTAPAKAVPVALRHAGLDAADIEYHEINEAFSVVALVNMQLMGLDHSKVNVNGGAVSLGHPIGCSGARILTTLLSVLEQNDAALGAASICNGGGGAAALVVERL